jgi:hypothetical protein
MTNHNIMLSYAVVADLVRDKFTIHIFAEKMEFGFVIFGICSYSLR